MKSAYKRLSKTVTRQRILYLFCILILLSGCTFLKTPEIKGVIVDAETGKPIEGVYVRASWDMTTSGPGGKSDSNFKRVRVKTDKDGRFKIPQYTLINFIPYPFGQGGSFRILFNLWGYKSKGFSLYRTDEIKVRTDELKDASTPGGITVKLEEIKDPKTFISERGYGDKDEAYRRTEDLLYTKKFGDKKWKDVNIQYDLAETYYRLGDYKSALKKLDEVGTDNPHQKTLQYFRDTYKQYKTALEKSKREERQK